MPIGLAARTAASFELRAETICEDEDDVQALRRDLRRAGLLGPIHQNYRLCSAVEPDGRNREEPIRRPDDTGLAIRESRIGKTVIWGNEFAQKQSSECARNRIGLGKL